MERLTRPNLNIDQDTDRFLNAAIGGKEIDWKQIRDSTLNVMINGPTSNSFGKDIFRKMARDLYGRLKAYEDIAELCGGFDLLRELAEADKDVYALFDERGTAHLNVGDIDSLERIYFPAELHVGDRAWQKAMSILDKKYAEAKKLLFIREPLAWALYQTWREFDDGKRCD